MNKEEIINQIKQIALKKNINVNDAVFSKPLKEIDRLGSNSIREIKNILTKNGLFLKKN
jgi:hypothetical protein